MAANHVEARLEEQDVVLTVPASFDDVARNLTVDAAPQGGAAKGGACWRNRRPRFTTWFADAQCRREATALKPGLTLPRGGRRWRHQ